MSVYRKTMVAIGVALLLQTPLVWAQEDSNAAYQGDEATRLDEVVVTARKYREAEQSAPISMVVIGRSEIENTHLESFKDIVLKSPGLNMSSMSMGRFSQINIRGVGSIMPSGREDGSVSVYVDEVPVPVNLLDSFYYDLSQVEVLRGPQGTLYGRNSQAGAINMATIQPGKEFGGDVSVGFAEGGYKQVSASLNTPFNDQVSGRFFVNVKQQNGLVDHPYKLNQDNENEEKFFRGIVKGDFGNLIAQLSFAYSDVNNRDIDTALSNNPNLSDFSFDTYDKHKTGMLALNLKYMLNDNIMLRSVTGLYHTDWDNVYGQSTVSSTTSDDTEKSISQEIALEGETNGGIKWNTGLFFQRWKYDLDMTGSGFLSYNESGVSKGTNYALFGEATFPIAQNWHLTTGLRGSYDRKEIDSTLRHYSMMGGLLPTGFVHRQAGTDSFWGISGRAVLTWDITSNDMVFASIARGYKPGGFQGNQSTAIMGISADTASFKDSSSWTYELGYKGNFLDDKVAMNATAFYVNTKDEQLARVNMATYQTYYSNEDTRAYGLELGAKVKLTPSIELGGSMQIMDSSLRGDSTQAGNALPYTPDQSFNIFMTYNKRLSSGAFAGLNFYTRADYIYRSDTWSDIDQTTKLDSYGLFNLNIGLENKRFRISAYLNNVFDEDYVTFGSFGRVVPGKGRQLGAQVTLKY